MDAELAAAAVGVRVMKDSSLSMREALGPLVPAILAFTVFVTVLLVVSRWTAGPTPGTTIDDARSPALQARTLDREDVPDRYTGELVDIDIDGGVDVALFGDPDAPIVWQLDERAPWAVRNSSWLLLATAVTAALVSAIVGPVVGAWAKARWASDPPGEDEGPG